MNGIEQLNLIWENWPEPRQRDRHLSQNLGPSPKHPLPGPRASPRLLQFRVTCAIHVRRGYTEESFVGVCLVFSMPHFLVREGHRSS